MPIERSQAETPRWRIDEIAPDFERIDTWALPLTARRSELPALEGLFLRLDPNADAGSRLATLLFALRTRLGRWFGWDEEANSLPIPGCRETSLRERLPADLRTAASAAEDRERFRLVYRTETEWARERSNGTVHAVLHVGWLPQQDGLYRAELGVYVKTRGRFGRLYMQLIRPFRHWIVYPALLRHIGRAWEARARDAASASDSRGAAG